MTLTQRTVSWQVLVYQDDDTTLDFTLPVTELHGTPGRVGGQNVRAAEGRAEGMQWHVDVLDRLSQATPFTARLSDADGYPHLMMRLVKLQRNLDGGGMATIATGRLVSIQLQSPLVYRMHMTDERTLERQVQVFTYADSCAIHPAGLRPDGGGGGYPTNRATAVWWKVTGLPGSGVVEMEQVTTHGIWEQAADVIKQDALVDAADAQGNFKHLRFRTGPVGGGWTGAKDHEVVGFNWSGGWGLAADGINTDHQILQKMRLVWNGTLPSVGQQVLGFYYAPTRPPDDMLPLHIGFMEHPNLYGGTFSTWSIDMMILVKQLYDGAYQDRAGTDITTVRYDSNIFGTWDPSTNPDGLISHPALPRWGCRLRITRPWGLYDFAEAVYQALGLVGFVNADNEVAPRRVLLPDDDLVTDPDLLPLVDDADIRLDGPPTWRQAGRERYTVVQYSWLAESGVWEFGDIGVQDPDYSIDRDLVPWDPGRNLDFVFTREETYEAVHPNVANLGRSVLKVWLGFMHDRQTVQAYADAHAAQVFERWAYGAVGTELSVLEGAPSVQPGDLVRLQSALYPNLDIKDRGGTRVLQVLQVPYDPSGRWLQLIDIGAAAQPLSTPTLGMTKDTTYPTTHVDVVVGSVPTGARYELQVASTNSATPPAKDDAAWAPWATGYGNDSFTIGPLPMGTYVHGRVRAHKAGRISSAWSSAQTVNLDDMSAPTGLSITGVTGSTATATWTNAHAELQVEVRIQVGAGAVETVKFLPAGTTTYTFMGLANSQAHTAYVRHRDRYGEPGPSASQGFSTTATDPTLDTPFMAIVKGDSVGQRYGWF